MSDIGPFSGEFVGLGFVRVDNSPQETEIAAARGRGGGMCQTSGESDDVENDEDKEGFV